MQLEPMTSATDSLNECCRH